MRLGARDEAVSPSHASGPRVGDTNDLPKKPGAAESSGSGKRLLVSLCPTSTGREELKAPVGGAVWIVRNCA